MWGGDLHYKLIVSQLVEKFTEVPLQWWQKPSTYRREGLDEQLHTLFLQDVPWQDSPTYAELPQVFLLNFFLLKLCAPSRGKCYVYGAFDAELDKSKHSPNTRSHLDLSVNAILIYYAICHISNDLLAILMFSFCPVRHETPSNEQKDKWNT
jgi:hypothetical protein